MGVETVSLIIAAFVNASLAIAALLRNIRSRLCVAFACWMGLMFVHDAVTALEKFQQSPWTSSSVTHSLAILLAGPATLWFLREMVAVHGDLLRKFMWPYVPLCFVFLGVLALPSFEPRLAPLLEILAHIAYLFPAGVWVLVLRNASSRSTLTREKLRLQYAYIGGIVTVGIFLTDILFLSGVSVPPLGTLARTLYMLFIFHTFVQKELMTAEEVLGKVALFSGVAVMLSTIYLFLVAWVGDKRDLFFFNTLIASVVIVVLFEPIRNFTAWATRKLVVRRNTMLEGELDALSQNLRGVVEPAELSRRISGALKKTVGIQSCSLFVLERDGLTFVRFDSEGVPFGMEEESATAPLVEYMTLRRGRPFVIETVENDLDSFHSPQARKFCEECLEGMRKLGADFILPFTQEGRVVGFTAVKSAETMALSNEQLRLFIPVSRQIAHHLRNSQTLGTLSERNKLAAVGEMAAGLAHEIKNPLGSIKGAAQLLAGQGLGNDASASEFLKIIVDETDRLSGVLTDFLDYAKPRRPQAAQGCDPVRVLEHATALVLRDAKVRVELQADSNGALVDVDPDGLKQVLLNLLLNAAEAMEGAESAAITLRVRTIRPKRGLPFADKLPLYKVWEGWQQADPRESRGLVEIEVADNGPGISDEDRTKIFTPFYTTKPRGTGLGLAICQRMIEAMGGIITVRPNRPRGTVFTIHLPLKEETETAPLGKLRPKEVPV
jgi:two-component system, NtrC family, sensor histidine kinase HydH